jgi:hypothetical protein
MSADAPPPPIAGLDPADPEAGEKAIEQWKIKKLIKSLEQARGCVPSRIKSIPAMFQLCSHSLLSDISYTQTATVPR